MHETVDDWPICGTGCASGCLFLTRNSKFRVSVYNEVILHSLVIGRRVVVQKETNYTRLLVNRRWLSSCLLADL